MNINRDVCTKCGNCLEECPTFAIAEDKTGLHIDPEKCIACAHCAAVCPAGAVEGCRIRKRCEVKPDTADFLDFMRNKRSVRRYSDSPVSEEDMATIVASAMSAATASNTMDWQLYMYTGEKLAGLRRAMLSVFVRLGRIVRLVLTSPVLRLIARATPARPYVLRKRTAQTFDGYLDEIRNGRDPLLFDAPLLMVLTSPKHNKNYGPVNCAIAGTQMMETALTLGIGSCMVGFAEYILNLFPGIKKKAGIPRRQKVFLVFTLGHTAVRFLANPIRDYPVLLNNRKFSPEI
ncbi:MAG: nitroreductase family protein [Spirochaetales bacterium]|nr:nitroreductase family protein [Spirochaetales bacterium]